MVTNNTDKRKPLCTSKGPIYVANMILHYVCFKIAQFLYCIIDDVFCRLFLKFSLRDGNLGEAENKFDSCAHVTTVLWRSKLMELDGATETNFILRHESFVHPRVILGNNSNITLMSVSDSAATFAQCDKDVHNLREVGPFFYLNQFKQCRRLITIPMHHFVTLMASADGTDNIRPILLSNTGRCGSTLLLQLFEKLPAVPIVSINEPEVLLQFASDSTKFTQNRDFSREEVLRACVRCLCLEAAAATKSGDIVILIKPKSIASAITAELAHLFPSMKHLYLYRHPIEYVRSIRAIVDSLMHPLLRSLLMRLSVGSGDMRDFVMTHFRDKKSERACRLKEVMMLLNVRRDTAGYAAMFVASVLNMQDLVEEECEIELKVVSYHELVEDPESVMREMAEYCGVEKAEREVILPNRDSQDETALSRSNLRGFRKFVTEEEVRQIDRMLTACSLPDCQTFPRDSETMYKIIHTFNV